MKHEWSDIFLEWNSEILIWKIFNLCFIMSQDFNRGINRLFQKHFDPITKKLDRIIERHSCSKPHPSKVKRQEKLQNDVRPCSKSTPNSSDKSCKKDFNFWTRNNVKSSTQSETRISTYCNLESLARLKSVWTILSKKYDCKSN